MRSTLTSLFVTLAATLLVRAASCQSEFHLRLAPGAAAGEPRLALHTDLDAAKAAQQLDAVLPLPGQAATGAPFVAANLFDTVSRARAGAASVVLAVAGTRIMITGVVDPARAGAGRVADDPAAKLREVLAGSDAHVVVVLTDLDRRAALQLLRSVPQATLVLQRTGGLADRTPAEVDGRFLVPWPDDGAARRFVATLQDGKLKAPRCEWLPADPAQAMAPLRQLLQGAAAPQPDAVIARSARSRAVELQVHDVRFADSYGGRIGPCLVVDAEFANVMPLQFVYDRQIPVAWRVPRLQDHVYLVVGGTRLLQLSPDAAALPGHLPAPEFTLARLGEHRRGNLVFPLPVGLRPGAGTAMDLRVYDFAHGHLMVQLQGVPPAAALPSSPVQHNEVVALGVYGVERRSELGGSTAPAGMTFVVVDVLARSTFRVDADATAFDPKAKTGQRLQVGTVADWTDSRRYLQLVVDGAVCFPPADLDFADALPAAPRFLPDLPTGGLVAFLAPAAAASLQLRCDFPNARSSIDGRLMRPKGFSIAIAGEPPALAELPVLASVKDRQFDVRVTRQEAMAAFGGVTAGQDQRFLLCDLEIRNVGKDGEFFQTKQQLQLATADGKLHELDPVTARGLAPAHELLWVPPSELRRCTAVYRIAAADDRLRLCYASVDAGGARMLALPALAVAATPAGPGVEPAVTTTPPPPAATGAERAATTSPGSVAVAAAPAAAAVPAVPRETKGTAGVGLTQAQVNAAIDRGATALWTLIKQQQVTMSVTFGTRREHYLAALALLHAGAHERLPEFLAALRSHLDRIDVPYLGVYELGLLCMTIEALGDARYIPLLRQAARALIDGQGPEGSWSYASGASRQTIGEPDASAVLRVLSSAPSADEAEWQRGPSRSADGDNSVSQFALLGLRAAQSCGVPVPKATWTAALQATGKRQQADGGWSYHLAGKSYSSMTCAGICALAVCRHALGLPQPTQDPAIERGVAWLASHFSVTRNEGHTDWAFYSLYSLERTGRILDQELIGDHEWYPEGASHLLNTQRADGTWVAPGTGSQESHEPQLATSFALLFLTRATHSLQAQKRSGPGTLQTSIALPPAPRIYVILDASGSMLEAMDGVPKFEIARAAVTKMLAVLPDRAEVALRVYGHRKRAIDPGAEEDTALEVPLQPLRREAFLAKLSALRARGKTPLTRSLLDALKDLPANAGDREVTVVLLTDGGDDTGARTRLPEAAEALGKRAGIRLCIVGFDIQRADWTAQLQMLAEKSRGHYLPAPKAQDLNNELQNAVLGTPSEFAIVDAQGAAVTRGHFGTPIELPEGRYGLSTSVAGQSFICKFWLGAGTSTAVVFDAGKLAKSK